MAEDVIELILYQYSLNFITYDIPQGAYTSREVLDYIDVFSKGGLQIEYDHTSSKTKLLKTVEIIIAMFDNKSFFKTQLGFTTYRDYEPNSEFVSRRIRNLGTIDEILLKCGCIDEFVVNILNQPELFTSVLFKPPGSEVFVHTKQYTLKN